MVLIAFNGPVEVDFLRIHNSTFAPNPETNRRNPNGCPMRTTLFVRGDATDSCAVSRMWAYGHEMAVGGYKDGAADTWIHADTGI